MNYTFYLKQQAKLYALFVLSSAVTYGTMCLFGWRKPIALTSGFIAAIVSGTLTYIFLGPIGFKYYDSLKK
jgi:hypothetical protein